MEEREGWLTVQRAMNPRNRGGASGNAITRLLADIHDPRFFKLPTAWVSDTAADNAGGSLWSIRGKALERLDIAEHDGRRVRIRGHFDFTPGSKSGRELACVTRVKLTFLDGST